MPVILSHRRWEIYLPQVMSWKAQYHEPPTKMVSPTKALSKVLRKLARSSSANLKYLNITRTTGSPNHGPTTISSNLNRVDLLAITVLSLSPHPQRMDSLPPTNMTPRNIEKSTIHTNRRQTHSRTPGDCISTKV